MSTAPHRSVRVAPSRPILIFDGNCHFCRRWVERWRDLTGGTIDYAPSQEVADRFPEITPEAFERSVQLVETDGTVFSGAEAVLRSLAYRRSRRWLIWSYEHLPGFNVVAESAYRLLAKHRQTSSFFTRILWGNDVRTPAYFTSRRWFLRSLGCIYLIAFVSLWVQVDGLIGVHGVLPAREYLESARDQLGGKAVFLLPTLCWFNASDGFLNLLCGAGTIGSLLLIFGLLPATSLILLFALYLSLTVAGQTFLSFQWDILLLETGFLALFFTPWRISYGKFWHKPRPGDPASAAELPISRIGHFLLKLLLFKLMLMSGVVKLTSGDDSWWNLTALDYHYETQPLPTIIGWWAHQSPEWFRKASTFFVLFVECVIPFFIWAPRRLRHTAAGLFILLQVFIGLTGNYCFFNLLTIALCLLLIDDTYWARKKLPRSARPDPRTAEVSGDNGRSLTGFTGSVRHVAVACALVVFLPMNLMLIVSAFKPQIVWPRPVAVLGEAVEPFRIVNGYGLFRVMTKTRPEIILEGSDDGVEWKPYEFRWKPGSVNEPPRWAAPHQPRLDWQMWFAALGTYQQNPWFVRLAVSLLKNTPEVNRLLASNPFPNAAPRYLRATLYEYHFTSWPEQRATGAWWKREETGEYLPPISLR